MILQQHITRLPILEFHSYGDEERPVELATNSEISYSLGYGRLPISLQFENTYHILYLENVQLVKDLSNPILSVPAFNKQFQTSVTLNVHDGIIVYRTPKDVQTIALIKNTGTFILEARTTKTLDFNVITNTGNNVKLRTKNIQIKRLNLNRKKCSKFSSQKIELLKREGDLMHERFGHISAPYLNRLKTCSTGVPEFIFNKTISNCQICNQAKMTRKTFDKDRDRAQYPCQIIHADLIMVTQPSHKCHSRYILTVLDDYTRFLQTFELQTKTQVPDNLDFALMNLKTMFPEKPYFRFLRTDNGGEFSCKETAAVLRKYDMQHDPYEPYVHEHNGLIERVHRTLEERGRALLLMSGFPLSFWNHALKWATYLYNRTPHSALDFLTPFEKAHNSKPDITNIRKFGSLVNVYDKTITRGNKFGSRSTKQYLIEITPTGYKTYDPITRKITPVCSVEIHEDKTYKTDFPTSYQIETLEFLSLAQSEDITRATLVPSTPADTSAPVSTHAQHGVSLNPSSNRDIHKLENAEQIEEIIDYDWDHSPYNRDTHESEDDEPLEIEETINYDWDKESLPITFKSCKLPSAFESELGHFDHDFLDFTPVPLTYKQATIGPNSAQWKIAIKNELDAMIKHNGTTHKVNTNYSRKMGLWY